MRARLHRRGSIRPRPPLPAAMVLGLGLVLGSCEALPDHATPVCGDGFIDQGEDCDGAAREIAGKKYACDLETCRMKCDSEASEPQASGRAASLPWGCCPPGWGTGTDTICRAPSGSFELQAATALRSDATRIELAAFDDAATEVILLGSTIDVFTLASSAIDAAFSTKLPGSFAALGRLGGNDVSLALPERGGVLLLRGLPDGGFFPFQSSLPLVETLTNARFAVLDARPSGADVDRGSGDEIAAFGDGRLIIDIGGAEPLTKSLAREPSEGSGRLAGELQTGQLDAQSPCEELVVAIEGAPEIWVFTPCKQAPSGAWSDWNDADPTPIALGPGWRVSGGVLVTDLDADLNLDVLIHAAHADGHRQLLAALGSAGSASEALLPVAPYQPAPDFLEELEQLPLAVGALDDNDTAPGIVLPGAIWLSTPSGTYERRGTRTLDTSLARIIDLNGDKRRDVVTASSTEPSLGILVNAGDGFFNEFVVDVPGPVAQMATGDFDGDLVPDLVIATRNARDDAGAMTPDGSAQPSGSSISVLFGSSTGVPQMPVFVGVAEPASIERVLVGRDLAPNGTLNDAMDDIVTIGRESMIGYTKACYAARTDRQLHSPFFFLDAPSASPNQPPVPEEPTRVVMGCLGGATAIVALTRPLALGPSEPPAGANRTLWTVKLRDESVAMSMSDGLPARYPTREIDFDDVDDLPALDWDSALMRAIDAGPCDQGSGGESQLAIVAANKDGNASTLLRVTLDGEPAIQKRTLDGMNRPVGIEIGDLDGDDQEDIVVLGLSETGPMLAVVWNDAEPSYGRPGDQSAEDEIGFTLAELDPSHLGKEIIFMGPQLVTAVQTLADPQTLSRASPSPQSRTFTFSPLQLPTRARSSRNVAIRAGDLVGNDGLDDLVLLGRDELLVFAAISANP